LALAFAAAGAVGAAGAAMAASTAGAVSNLPSAAGAAANAAPGIAAGPAPVAYVSDELVLGVYAEQNQQGQRLATLHSGARVETLASSGDFTQVRLADGTTGWVRSAFLVTRVPAAARVKELEDELSRTRATTPALAAAAATSEVERLRGELAASQAQLAIAGTARPREAAQAPGVTPLASLASLASLSSLTAVWAHPWIAGIAVLLVFAAGFWMGYATLARRIRAKFGGIKVY
jgi:SH3-like domain-containing protein